MHHKFMTLAGIMLAGIMSFAGFAPANAATDTPFTEVRDGIAIMHTGAYAMFDLNGDLTDGEWACRATSPNELLYTSVDTELGWMYASTSAGGTYTAPWVSCSFTAPAVKHEFTIKSVDVEMTSVSYGKHNKKGYLNKMTNGNSPVTWPNGDIALKNNGRCMAGSFDNPEPELVFGVGANKTRPFRTVFGPDELDWVCFIPEDGVIMGYHDSSMPEGMRRGKMTSVTVWGRTFGSSRPAVG